MPRELFKGVAAPVLDWTNSRGELQGAAIVQTHYKGLRDEEGGAGTGARGAPVPVVGTRVEDQAW